MVIKLSVYALIFSILGNLLINFKSRNGYVLWIVSNIIWINVGLMSDEKNYPQILMYAIYIILNLQGIYNWSKKEKSTQVDKKGIEK